MSMDSSPDTNQLLVRPALSHIDTDTELSFTELDSMKSMIGTIWTDMSSLMNKYQAQLVLKHQKLDPSSLPVNTRSSYQTSNTQQLTKCQKEVSSLLSKLSEKDSEIVKLRSEIQKFKSVLMVKDNLIEKIQKQMTQEALDYHTEIAALKEMLEERERAVEGQDVLEPQETPVPVAITMAQSAKRRRVGANGSVTPKRPTVSSLISSAPRAHRASSSSTEAANPKPGVDTPDQSSRGKSPRGEPPPSPDGAAVNMDANSDSDDDDEVDDDFDPDEAASVSRLESVKDLMEEQGKAQRQGKVKPGLENTSDEPEPNRGDDEGSDDKPHQCRVCSYRATRRSNLTRHVKVVHGDAPKIRFQCDSCDRSFSTKTYLLTHTSTEHELDETICDLCSEVLPNESRLLQHLRREHNLGDHVCDYCGAAQVSKRELQIHKRKHTGERPYVCPWCEGGFSASKTLTRHRKFCSKNPHREEVFCGFCQKQFSSKRTLDMHVKVIHEEKIDLKNCEKCERTFKFRSSWIRHRMKCVDGIVQDG